MQRPSGGSSLAALGAAVEEQRVERLLPLDLAAGAQGQPDVDEVGEQEDDADGDPQRRRRPPGERPGDGEEGEEEEQVALQGRRVGVQLHPLLAALAVEVGEEADQAHRQRRRAGRGRRRSPRSRRLRSPRWRRAGRRSRSASPASRCRPRRGSLPTAPSPRFSLWPSHSTAPVNSSAPARTTAKLTTRSDVVHRAGYGGDRINRSGEVEGEAEDDVDREQLDPLEPGRLAVVGDVVGDHDRQQDRRRARSR